jgi:cellulose synthase/poly-beta-1,6-N-acetylglucosamine synthase-like glycosyltransferase
MTPRRHLNLDASPDVKPATMESLAAAFALASARLAPSATPWRSVAIHGAVLLFWVALFAFGLGKGGLLAWSVGAAYVAYDTLLQGFVAWHAWQLLRPRVAATALPGPDVAVVIAAHNEAAVLPATIAALLAQTDPPAQILIADDGSTDGTAALLAQRYGLQPPALGRLSAAPAAYPTLAWLRLAHGGKARALNAAVLHVRAQIVVTVDADTLLDARAIGAMALAFAREPELVAATGVITPACRPTVAGRCLQWFQTYEYIRNFISRFAWMQVRSLLLISGAFAGVRRSALLAVGGFDPACLVEDYELSHRLYRHALAQQLDWRIRVLGEAQARTEAPGSVGAFLRQRRRWFGGFLQTQYWYRAMVGDRRYGWLGRLMLPVKAVDTLQPLYGLTAFVLLVVYALRGRLDVIAPVGAVIGMKIALDLLFHAWSVHVYRRWVGDAARASLGWALLAALVEPFSFQLLRHTGALLGWFAFLGGGRKWGRQTRYGLRSADEAARGGPRPS